MESPHVFVGGGQTAYFPQVGRVGVSFARWCQGMNGHKYIDTHMIEPAATGWMRNCERRVLASLLVDNL
ncbi:MAG: hypothetical protein FJ344_03260 [Sphingomonadales bacterium]|nr:hypothetical protein [Sphingomonadales bacterium]